MEDLPGPVSSRLILRTLWAQARRAFIDTWSLVIKEDIRSLFVLLMTVVTGSTIAVYVTGGAFRAQVFGALMSVAAILVVGCTAMGI